MGFTSKELSTAKVKNMALRDAVEAAADDKKGDPPSFLYRHGLQALYTRDGDTPFLPSRSARRSRESASRPGSAAPQRSTRAAGTVIAL